MRNLKRALSLGLTAAMISGLMVMGSSAAGNYADVADTDNVEAIDVLQTINVMVGDGSNFNPDQNVTREEMAVIMCRLLDYTVSTYKGTTNFTDVDAWALPYVEACYTNGIIAGYSDTQFGGGDPVTTGQASLMILKALGYFQEPGDFGSDWLVETIRQGAQINLFDKVNNGANDALTRNDVAQIVLNALQAECVQISDHDLVSDGKGGFTTKATYDGRNKVTAWDNILDADTGAGLQLGEELYEGDLQLVEMEDDFGRPAVQWKYGTEEIGTYADSTQLKATYTAKATRGELYSLVGSSVVRDLEAGRCDLTVFVDGKEVTNPNLDNYFVRNSSTSIGISGQNATGNGTLTEVYMDKENNVTVVQVNTYLVKATADYNTTKESLSVEVVDVDCATAPALNTVIENADVDVSSFKEGDYILVTYSYDTKQIESAQLAEVVTGEVSEFTVDDYVIMDGTTYKYDYVVGDNVSTLEFTVGEDAKVVLDAYGYIIYVDEAISSNSYVYIADTGSYSTNGKTAIGNAYYPDGTYDEVVIKKVDGETGSAATQGAQGWYTYSKDTNGHLTLNSIQTPNADAYGKVEDNAYTAGVTVLENGKIKFMTNATESALQNLRGDSSTIFVVVDADDNVNAYTGVANAPDITTSAGFTGDIEVGVVYKVSTKYAKYVFIDVSNDPNASIEDANSAADYLFLLKDTGNRTVSGDDTYYKYKVVYDGVETEKFVESSLVTGQKVGMLFRDIKENDKGYITKATPFGGTAYDNGDKRDEFTMSAANNDEITYSNDTLTFTINNSDKDYIIASDCNVTLAFGKNANLDLVDEGDNYTLYQTSARGMAGMLKDYDLTGKVYVAVEDTDSLVATDIYVWIESAVGTTSGGGSPVSTDAVALSASQISNASDVDLLSGKIAYYKQSGSDVTTLEEQWALLEKAGCTDISITDSRFNYTTASGQKVNNTSVTATRYYKITVDDSTYYLKDGDTVKASGGTEAMKATYFSVDGGAVTTVNNASTGYTVNGKDAVIKSGYFAVNVGCMNTTVGGDGTDKALFKVNQPAAQVFLRAGETFQIELEIQTSATTKASTVTISGADIVTTTITVDAGTAVGTKIPVDLTLADAISSNLDTNEISVSVKDKT